MKNILILTDFSEHANIASEYAIELAKKATAEVNFLHLQKTPIDWVKLSKEKEKNYPDTKQAISNSKNELSKWVKKSEEKGITAHQSQIYNTTIGDMLSNTIGKDFDFIIMGSYGAKGLKEKIVGSNAQYVIRNSPIPVLILKNSIHEPIKNILFVSDFTDVSKESFHTLTGFADTIDAHIDLLFVNTNSDFKESSETKENMDNLMTHCNRKDVCTKNIIRASSIEDGVNTFIKTKPIDFLAICTHGKSALKQLFTPSIAEKLANHSELPLLSIKL